MPEYPRQQWAVPVAQHVAEAVRLIRARGRDIDADLMRDYIETVFSHAIFTIGTVPGGEVQREVERLILEDGLAVEEALDQVGC